MIAIIHHAILNLLKEDINIKNYVRCFSYNYEHNIELPAIIFSIVSIKAVESYLGTFKILCNIDVISDNKAHLYTTTEHIKISLTIDKIIIQDFNLISALCNNLIISQSSSLTHYKITMEYQLLIQKNISQLQ